MKISTLIKQKKTHIRAIAEIHLREHMIPHIEELKQLIEQIKINIHNNQHDLTVSERELEKLLSDKAQLEFELNIR